MAGRDDTGGNAVHPMPAAAGPMQALAALVSALHTPRFTDALRDAIGAVCAFDSMVVTAYSEAARPLSLYHDFDDVQAAINISFYESGPYLLDPFFLAGRDRIRPGAYRLIDLAPDAFFKSEYYRTFYRRIRLSDELGLIMRAEPPAPGSTPSHKDPGRWLVMSLARRVRRPKFSADDIAAVNDVFPVVSAAVLAHWKPEGEAPAAIGANLPERLKSFGSDLLSPREMEIVQLILQGHSTPSAAAVLGIAEGTVKVHRRHAYAKLGIVSQAELFSRATRYLTDIAL